MKISFLLSVAALAIAAPVSASPLQGDEPIAVPSNILQGIDFVYVDPRLKNLATQPRQARNWLLRTIGYDWGYGTSQRQQQPNPVFTELDRGLRDYQASWGRLPQIKIPSGPALKAGDSGKRVDILRTRLGLPVGGEFDSRLSELVSTYQRIHGLDPADGIAGKDTIASLNRGAAYYERRIAINMERAHRLPPVGKFARYVVVDSGAAEVYLFDHDRPVDGMRAVVGSPKTKTPMMAVIMSDAKANPYWNVPPELIRSLTAKRIGQQGLSYLKNYHYDVLSNWSGTGQVIDPATVDWKAIASGRTEPTIRVRQRPGPWNSMGEMKFEMPNAFGIYLHDSPHKALFTEPDRWQSNGCVRLEDYKRFASWIFGDVPQAASGAEETFPVPQPVPVYMTYLTVKSKGNGIVFMADPYGFDAQAMSQMFGQRSELALAD